MPVPFCRVLHEYLNTKHVGLHPGNKHRNHIQLKKNASAKTSGQCITQLAKMSIGSKFVELAADVFIISL